MEKIKKLNNWESTIRRYENIDLLRVMCSFFVVFEHFCETTAHNAFGFTYDTSMNAHVFLRLIYGIARFAVPCFFIISGYLSVFSKNQKIGKAVGLFSMAFFYSLIPKLFTFFIQCLRGNISIKPLSGLFHLLIPDATLKGNYFLYLYVAIYFISPFVNNTVLKLTKKQYLQLLIICIVLFSAWSTIVNTYIGATNNTTIVGLFFTSRTGTSMGFNVANFLTLYLVGGYLRLHYSPHKKKTYYSLLLIVISTILTTLLKLYLPQYASAVLFYDSLFVTVGAIAFFVVFLSIRYIPQKKLCQFLSVAGRNTFGVYLIHGFVSYILERFLSIEEIVSKGFWGTLLGIIVFVIGTFFLSVAFSALIRIVFKPLNNRVKKSEIYNRYTIFPV